MKNLFFGERGSLKGGPIHSVEKQHGFLVSISQSATQIYAEKCTTKPIAFKLPIEFPNTAPEEERCYSWYLPQGKKKEKEKEKLRTHPWLNPLFRHNPPSTLHLRAGVCNIWSHPRDPFRTPLCRPDYVPVMADLFTPVAAFPAHLGQKERI